MKNNTSLIVSISNIHDLDKITSDTKYINLDIANINNDVIDYFMSHGENYLYSDIISGIKGYTYVNYDEFFRGESIISLIFDSTPKDLDDLERAKYLYVSIAKYVSFDINSDISKNEVYNLSLISNTYNIWGSLALGKVTDKSVSKIYYYLCKRLNILASIVINQDGYVLNKLDIANQVLMVNLFRDIPYIQAHMQTRYFATYNDDVEIDKKIGYLKNRYTDYYIDKVLKDIDYTKEDCVSLVLSRTQELLDIESIHPTELSVIYNYIFNKYCPNYDIKINNLFLNDDYKNHFIMISYNDMHYSFNYHDKSFVAVTNNDIIYNLDIGKIGLYLDECIPNISNLDLKKRNC